MADDKFAALHPAEIIRKHAGPRFFGLRHTALDDAIKRGEIPAPIPLTPGGRARGWLGATILEHQRRLAEAAKQQAESTPSTGIKRVRARRPR